MNDNGEVAKYVRYRKRYDNAIFYLNANEHALSYRHRNRYLDRL